MVFPTNLVVLQWQGEQDPVLTSIQAMHAKTRFGTVTGIVTAVEPAPKGALPCFDLKPISRGPTERYAPNWDFAAKSFDKNFTLALAAMNVGDKVKVNWNYDERKLPRRSRSCRGRRRNRRRRRRSQSKRHSRLRPVAGSCRVREANRGNGGLRTESNRWEHVWFFWTGSRNAPFRSGSVLHPPYV